MNEQRETIQERLRVAELDRDWAMQYGDKRLLVAAQTQIVECQLWLRYHPAAVA